MHDAASHRRQAAAFYELARGCDDAFERLGYFLQAMECDARAMDAEQGKQPTPATSHP